MDKAAGQLIQLDQARKALARVASVDEAKQIRDKAEALRNYAKQQSLGLESQNKAAEIKIRAERRAGELLEKIERKPGGGAHTGKKRSNQGSPTTYEDTIKDAGIAKQTAARWQKEASIPEPIFEAFVGAAKDSEMELTSASVVRLAETQESAPAREMDKRIRNDPRLLWAKNVGKLARLLRFFAETEHKVRKKDVANLIMTLEDGIKMKREIERRMK